MKNLINDVDSLIEDDDYSFKENVIQKKRAANKAASKESTQKKSIKVSRHVNKRYLEETDFEG